jgi:hypothetical protein
MRYGLFLPLIVACLLGSAYSQDPLFTLVPGNLDPDGIPISDAKVCLTGAHPTCYHMPDLTRGDVTYVFGLDPHAEAMMAPGPVPWLLFDATYSALGSGSLTQYAILRSEGTYLVDVLSGVALTNVSDHAIWHEPKFSPFPLVVSADFVWGKNETHFGRHSHTVEVRRYDPDEHEYFRILTYRTSRKYAGGDSAPIRVLAPERAEILRRLGHLTPNP